MNHSRTCCRSKERTKGKESIIKVAAIQTEPYFGEKEKNIQRQLQLIEKAGNEGVLLLTLPELASTEYVFNTREELIVLSATALAVGIYLYLPRMQTGELHRNGPCRSGVWGVVSVAHLVHVFLGESTY